MKKQTQILERETNQVATFFHGYAADFDSIYGHTKKRSWVDSVLDQYFRESMRLRFDLSIEHAGAKHIDTILDVGCGGGVYCEALLQKGKTVTGIDIAEGMLTLAHSKTARFNVTGKISYIHNGYLNEAFPKPFDAAILTGFFDYIQSPLPVLKKLEKDVTKEIYMSFPKKGGFLGWQRKVRYSMRTCPLYYYSEKDLHNLLNQMGWLKKATITSIERDFFVRVVL